jgi:hypothetical protein
MRRWRKLLALAAGILGGIGGLAASANAQFAPPGAFGSAPPVVNGGPPVNAFGAPPNVNGVAPAGVFGGDTGFIAPADFPNPAVPSPEPVSPFSLLPGGMQNAFSRSGGPPATGWNGFADGDPARTPLFGPVDLFVRAEYLNWHVSNGPIAVPLLTTTSAFNAADFGQLGVPTTTILQNSGSNVVNYGDLSGVRFAAGMSFFEVSGFWFNQSTTVFGAGSLYNPTQALAIPVQITTPTTSVPGAFPLNNPPNGSLIETLGGRISVASELTFWGADANLFLPVIDDEPWKLELLAGFRYLRLDENLTINTLRGPFNPGGFVPFQSQLLTGVNYNTTTMDSFGTTNAFNGGQVGMRGIVKMGNWSLSGEAKFALGDTTERLNVNGSSALVSPTTGQTAQTAPGGIFALPSNSGTFANNKIAFVPEANLTLSYHFDFVRVFAGYNFLYWSQVTRPGDALNNAIDPRQIPIVGPPNFTPGIVYGGPGAPTLTQRGFIAQGFFGGIELKF